MDPTRRLVYGIGWCSAALLAAGCVLPCATPQLCHLPGVEPGAQGADCHVFRYDASVHRATAGEYGEYKLTELLPGPDGKVPSHTFVSVDHGHWVVGSAPAEDLNGDSSVSRTRLRLYRPGYKLVELEAWDSAAKIRWQAAAEWHDQEKTLDALLSGPAAKPPAVKASRPPLVAQLPTFSNDVPAETGPLTFAAAEYDRVAKLAPTPEDAARLKEKADALRKAAEPPKPATRPTANAP
jgi:hypothetical protein